MKTIRIFKSLIIAMIVFLAYSTYATIDPTNISSKENKMDRVIARAIDFPSISKNDNCNKATVSVDLKVAEDGHIIVKEINGNPTFTSYVKEKLESLVLKKMSELTGKSFIYRFVFSK